MYVKYGVVAAHVNLRCRDQSQRQISVHAITSPDTSGRPWPVEAECEKAMTAQRCTNLNSTCTSLARSKHQHQTAIPPASPLAYEDGPEVTGSNKSFGGWLLDAQTKNS